MASSPGRTRRGWAEAALDTAGFDHLRARLVSLACLVTAVVVALANLLDSAAFPIRSHAEVGVAIPLALLAEALWAWRRGPRLTDVEILALLGAWPVVLAESFVRLQSVGSALAGEWNVLVSGILVAVLVRRRLHVAVMTGLVSASMSWIVWARLGPTGAAPVTLVMELTNVVTVLWCLRAVRDVAVRALDTVSRGELVDPLTGLLNRRGLDRHAPRIWQAALPTGGRVVTAVVDIDHFKKVNDTRGHLEGDRVIRGVADLLRAACRADDVVVRLGGEEFLVLAAVDGPGEGPALGERLRVAGATTLAPITVSVGVRERRPAPDDDIPAAVWVDVDRADLALYAAKRRGRNRVVAAGDVRLPADDPATEPATPR